MRRHVYPGLSLLLLIALPAAARAQEEGEPQPHFTLEPIVVTATRQPQSIMQAPAAISVVDESEIQDARSTVSLTEPLDRVPGTFVQDSGNYAQGPRIQIRGFGTRAPFGIQEIKVLVDGLPETLPDGTTELDGVDLSAMRRIEVLRGPASQLYGNASGGVIQLFTEDGPDTPQATLRLTGGSYGLGKYELQGGGTSGPARLFLQGSYLQTGGYRDHSASRNGVINAKLRYDFSPETTATFLLNALDTPEAQDPGGLTTEQVRADRRQARPLNVQLDAGEEVQQVKLGATASHHSGPHEVSGYAYALYRNFDNSLPITTVGDGIVTFERVSPGGGLRYVYSAPVAGWDQQLALGFDTQYQDDDRRRSTNNNGQRGELGLHQFEHVTGFGPYFREAVFVTPDIEISGGLRYDLVHYDVDVQSSLNPGGGGSLTFDKLSPGGGIVYSPRSWLSLYGNIGTAFQVPTTTQLANPNGPGFNPDLVPQTATNYEIGARADTEQITGGVSLYDIQVNDELIPFESPSGRTAFQNAGRSHRYGMELDWQALLPAGVRWTSSLTLLHARFTDYQTAAGNFDGNQETGIPPWQVYEELSYRHWSGVFAALEGFLVGGYYVDDANTARSRGYEVLNLRVGYTREIAGFTLSPFLGLANINDSFHDGTVRLNALGGRYYEPAPGFNVYGGVSVTCQL